ncbi:MAG: class B sortase [Oscillospiraceae bacterium]|nr:class B sortase [Oscillospiraceae bacterium]
MKLFSSKGKNAGKTPVLRITFLLIFLVIFIFSAYKLISEKLDRRSAEALRTEMLSGAVTIIEPTKIPSLPTVTPAPVAPDANSGSADGEASPEPTPDTRPTWDDIVGEIDYVFPIDADFALLRETAPNTAAWVYCPDTQVNYPIVAGTDNQYYTGHLPDGSVNPSGAIFLDYRCSSDFSDEVSLVYGHNIRSGSMFGVLPSYEKQSFFEDHPVWYLETPDGRYELWAVAGIVVYDEFAEHYIIGDEMSTEELLSYAEDNSVFENMGTRPESGKIVIFSTCAYNGATGDDRFLLFTLARKVG